MITLELPRVLTATSARELGISRSAIRHAIARGRWRRLAQGLVLTGPDETTRRDWVLAGLALAGPSAALSGWDAVRRAGIGSREPPAPHVLVLARTGENRLIGKVRVRPTARTPRIMITSADDPVLPLVPVVSIERAIADTALAHRTLAPVRAMVTQAIQRGRCCADDIAREVDAGPRNGSALLRRALDDLRAGALSVAEAEAADQLRRVGVPPFELNVPIVDPFGRLLAIADVLWRELRAVLEVDSREFHFAEPDWKATMSRHNRLIGAGLAIMHYPPSAIRDRSSGWAIEVRDWLRARAAEVGVPYRPARRTGKPPASAARPPVLPPEPLVIAADPQPRRP